METNNFDMSKRGDIDYIIRYGVAQNPTGVMEALVKAYNVNPALVSTPEETVIQLKRRYNAGQPIWDAFKGVKIDPRNGAGKNFKGSDAAGLAGGDDNPKPFGQTFVGGLLQTVIPGIVGLFGGGGNNSQQPAPAPDNDPEETPYYKKPEGIVAIIGLLLALITVAALLFKGTKGKGA